MTADVNLLHNLNILKTNSRHIQDSFKVKMTLHFLMQIPRDIPKSQNVNLKIQLFNQQRSVVC